MPSDEQRMQRSMFVAIIGVVAYIVVDELLAAVSLGTGPGATLITTLAQLLIGVLVVISLLNSAFPGRFGVSGRGRGR